MQALDVELAAEYLVIAATLVFLKSKSLLPPIPLNSRSRRGVGRGRSRRGLRERLIAYSKLSRRRQRSAGARARSGRLLPAAEGGDPSPSSCSATESTSPSSRARPDGRAAGGQARETDDRTRTRVAHRADGVRHAQPCGADGRAELFRARRRLDRPGIIVTFLAILELVRRGRIDVQPAVRIRRYRDLLPAPPRIAAADDTMHRTHRHRRAGALDRGRAVRRLRSALDQDAGQADRRRRSRRYAGARADRRRLRRARHRAARDRRRLSLREFARGARSAVEAYLLPPKTNLSPAALETLAIVAYMQPVTKARYRRHPRRQRRLGARRRSRPPLHRRVGPQRRRPAGRCSTRPPPNFSRRSDSTRSTICRPSTSTRPHRSNWRCRYRRKRCKRPHQRIRPRTRGSGGDHRHARASTIDRPEADVWATIERNAQAVAARPRTDPARRSLYASPTTSARRSTTSAPGSTTASSSFCSSPDRVGQNRSDAARRRRHDPRRRQLRLLDRADARFGAPARHVFSATPRGHAAGRRASARRDAAPAERARGRRRHRRRQRSASSCGSAMLLSSNRYGTCSIAARCVFIDDVNAFDEREHLRLLEDLDCPLLFASATPNELRVS